MLQCNWFSIIYAKKKKASHSKFNSGNILKANSQLMVLTKIGSIKTFREKVRFPIDYAPCLHNLDSKNIVVKLLHGFLAFLQVLQFKSHTSRQLSISYAQHLIAQRLWCSKSQAEQELKIRQHLQSQTHRESQTLSRTAWM